MSTPAHLIAGLAPDPACPTCHRRGVVWDWSALGWTVCPTCGGSGTVPPPYTRVPFDYAFSDLPVPNDTSQAQTSIQIGEDAPFEHTHWILLPKFGNAFTLQVQDLSTGWQFSSQGLDNLNFARGAKFSFPLLVPYIWHPLAEAQVTAAALVNGAGNNFQLVMRGFKLLPPDYYEQQLQAIQQGASQ